MLGRLFDKLARAPGGSANSRPLIWSAIERMLREENCKSRILLDTVESSEYTVGHGLREGSVLSPILYAVFVDGIVDRLEKAGCVGSRVGSETVRCLLYADDIYHIADSAADLRGRPTTAPGRPTRPAHDRPPHAVHRRHVQLANLWGYEFITGSSHNRRRAKAQGSSAAAAARARRSWSRMTFGQIVMVSFRVGW
jgi:hypothetical protein